MTTMRRTRTTYLEQNGQPLTCSEGPIVFARPASTAMSRSGDRIVCLVFALMLLPVFTTAGRTQSLAETPAAPTLAPLARKVIPGVVGIAARASAPVQGPIVVGPESGFPGVPYRSTEPVINAAGVIVDARRGFIVTNTHAIEQASDIAVTLSDGRHFQASRVDADPDTDITVIKIETADLVALPIGNSDMLEVGDYIIAVGNPFGVGTTVSHGIVSGLHRSGLHLGGYQDFIQTDASLNPGSSGGALVNLRGELVGIATAITSPAGINVGIGFAIPANKVREAIDRALKYGEAQRIREQD